MSVSQQPNKRALQARGRGGGLACQALAASPLPGLELGGSRLRVEVCAGLAWVVRPMCVGRVRASRREVGSARRRPSRGPPGWAGRPVEDGLIKSSFGRRVAPAATTWLADPRAVRQPSQPMCNFSPWASCAVFRLSGPYASRGRCDRSARRRGPGHPGVDSHAQGAERPATRERPEVFGVTTFEFG